MYVRCPTCRKKVYFPDQDARRLAVCAACGTRYLIPDPLTEEEEQGIGTEERQALRQDFPPGEPEGGSVSRKLVASVVLTACALVLVVAWAARQAQAIRGRRVQNASIQRLAMPATKPAHAPAVVTRPRITATPIRPAAPLVVQSNLGPRRGPVPLEFSIGGSELPESAPPPQPSPSEVASIQEATTRPALARRPPIHPIGGPIDDLDPRIGRSITKGIDFLIHRFDSRANLLEEIRNDPKGESLGLDALCVYALMQCEQATGDPRLNPHEPLMKGLIRSMKMLPLGENHWETYSRALRATALSLYNRTEDRESIRMDAAALVRGSNGGGYTYQLAKSYTHGTVVAPFGAWDNSNTQYGLLGVWSAAEVGFEVPENYWLSMQEHWVACQCPNGQWAYMGIRPLGGGTHSMTCAGLASLFVTSEFLDMSRIGVAVGLDPYPPAVWKGLLWLEDGDNAVTLNHGGYDLYGLERVGLASGFKYFGTHDWYRELAQEAIDSQQPDGSWAGSLVETAYNLLFLSRGRHPILMNKLRFNGYWANRPQDIGNLARYASHQLERQLNWQVVPLDRNWPEWMDSPILYLASHKPVKLTSDDCARIRQFVENGGLLFTQADGNAPEFNQFARALATRLFPAYELEDVPPDHPLNSVMFKLHPAPPLKMVSNGSRILMLHSTTDLTKYWQMRDTRSKSSAFEFGMNLFVYAAGKRDLRNRLVSTYLPPLQSEPRVKWRIARLKYPGNWDPEPTAWARFSRWFGRQTGYGIEVVDVPIKDLNPQTAPIADLTGNARYVPTAAEVEAIRNYVQGGGVLLVDICGGSGPFGEQLQSDLFFKAFADTPLRVMSDVHPLLNASAAGMDDLSRPRLRQFATELLGRHAGLPEMLRSGKGHVVYTSLDLTTALLGTSTWGIMGYDPTYAEDFVKNLILWTADGQSDEPVGAATEP